MTDRGDINDRVVSAAKSIEEAESVEEIPYLDAEYLCDSRGHVKEVTIILTSGGPHIEVDTLSGAVQGYWGGDSHRVPIFEDNVISELGRRMADRFEENHLHQ